MLLKKVNPRTILIIISLVLMGSLFYWFELRPAKIRQECSWVKHTEEAIPAKPAMSEEELRAEGFIKDCGKEGIKFYGEFNKYDKYFDDTQSVCESKNKQIIEGYKTARPAVPAKDWYSKATDKQYDFCIKEKGLAR